MVSFASNFSDDYLVDAIANGEHVQLANSQVIIAKNKEFREIGPWIIGPISF